MEENHNRFESDTGFQYTSGRQKLLVVVCISIQQDATVSWFLFKKLYMFRAFNAHHQD
jgi:hypothetical protein